MISELARKASKLLQALPPEATPIVDKLLESAGALAQNDPPAALKALQAAERNINKLAAKAITKVARKA